MRAIEHYFSVMVSVRGDLTFEPVDVILKYTYESADKIVEYNHSNQGYPAILMSLLWCCLLCCPRWLKFGVCARNPKWASLF